MTKIRKIEFSDRFTSSLKQWAKESSDFEHTSAIEEVNGEVSNYIGSDDFFNDFCAGNDSFDQKLLSVAVHALARQSLRRLGSKQAFGLRHCESPIEQAVFLALFVIGQFTYDEVLLEHPNGATEHADSDPALIIRPQAQLGEYRVDFIVSLKGYIPDYSNSEQSQGGYFPSYLSREWNVIIECDGHDYHDRTKEQAKRDKQRDRVLQSLGYPVFRYTGSEIWEDVFKCAHEVLRFLDERYARDQKKARVYGERVVKGKRKLHTKN